ncbi:MAG: 1-acyl-sn-glycerol-3-phosphate acyltransferase [Ruminococcus sp.]|nr:1-acyl-sn-glycerol-3-phosphate acyltransferase [Ruminococcus sp.]
MMKLLEKIGNAILTALIYLIASISSLFMRLLYRGRVKYTDPSAKQVMKQGAVLIANHKSHKDGFFLPMLLFPRRVFVLVTRKWYDKRFLKPLFERLPYIPIDLTQPDASWVSAAEEALKKGKCVLIFPEGKLEKNGKHEPFNSGFLLPVKHLGTPVIPMAIKGDYRLFHRQTLVVGKPVKLELNQKGRLSAILRTASEQCEREVFRLAGEADESKNEELIDSPLS